MELNIITPGEYQARQLSKKVRMVTFNQGEPVNEHVEKPSITRA